VGHNLELRSCQGRAMGHNSLQVARSCLVLAEGSQVRSTRLQGRRQQWRHRMRWVMLGVSRPTLLTR
jgi:hypothetical protein